MVENHKPPLDLRTVILSKQGDRHVISDAAGNRFILTPISEAEPLIDGPRILGKTIIQRITGRNANIYKVANDRGEISAVKEVTLEHCKRGAAASVCAASGGTEGASVSWKPLSLPDREFLASQRIEKVAKNHPNLLRYDGAPIKTESGSTYLEREWAEGESLEALLKKDALTKLQILDVTSQVLDATSCVHSAGVVHRDIKPTNIIVHLEDGRLRGVKLIDLGAASMKDMRENRDTCTQITTCFFTPGFGTSDSMVDPCEQDDLFSIGATLLYALTGKDAEDIHDRGNAIYQIPEELTGPLRKVLENTLQVRIDKRYASCEEMGKVLRRAIRKEVGQNPEMKLERAKMALTALEESYRQASGAVRGLSKKSIDITCNGWKGVYASIFEWGTSGAKADGLDVLLLPITFPLRVIGLAIGIPVAIGCSFVTGLLYGTYHLVNGPVRAIHKLPNRIRMKTLETAVERERLRLEQEKLLLTK